MKYKNTWGGVLYNSIIIKVWHERNFKNLIKTGPILVESLGLLWENKKCVWAGGGVIKLIGGIR